MGKTQQKKKRDSERELLGKGRREKPPKRWIQDVKKVADKPVPYRKSRDVRNPGEGVTTSHPSKGEGVRAKRRVGKKKKRGVLGGF